MSKWKIPQPIWIDWQLREVSSANIVVRELEDGRQQHIIEHAPLPGVKPEMMVWFLHNIDRTDLRWRGYRLLAYRYWHPRDHVYFKILGRPGQGCRFHIVEAFQANPNYLMDAVFHVPKLDDSGFRLEIYRLGSLVFAADEEFADSREGMRYKVTVTVGSTTPVLAPITRLMRRHFLNERLDAWHRHNVEEVGNLPHFLPELYAAHAKGFCSARTST